MSDGRFDYQHEGTELRGYLTEPESVGKVPAVLIAHEAPGVGEHVKARAGMLADLGFVALAADMYGDGRLAANSEESMQLMTGLRGDVPLLRGRIRAAFDALARHPLVNPDKIAVIGYCFGGLVALELARSGAPVVGTASFHGILETERPAEAAQIKGRVLAFTGSSDPLVPPAQVQSFQDEMTEANVDWELVTFGGALHGFSNFTNKSSARPGFAYSQAADERSWKMLRQFFDEIFEQ